MQMARRWLFLAFSLTMFVFTGIRGWASPFHGTPLGFFSTQTQEHAEKAEHSAAIFTGTVARKGGRFVLRDLSGDIYALDNTERASAFEGQSVEVVGKLDTHAKLIHVESLEPRMA